MGDQYEAAMLGGCDDFAPDYQAQGDCVNCGHVWEAHPKKEAATTANEKLGKIREAIEGYYSALDRKENGGAAIHTAFVEIQKAMGMRWAQGGAAKGKKKPKRQMKVSNFCAMTCQEGAFIKFIGEISDVPIEDAQGATNFVRGYCVIESRRELDTNPEANQRWQELRERYDAWLRC